MTSLDDLHDPITLPLPTEPMSVICDVTTSDGERWGMAVLAELDDDDDYPWLATTGLEYDWLRACDIASFVPARIVKEGDICCPSCLHALRDWRCATPSIDGCECRRCGGAPGESREETDDE